MDLQAVTTLNELQTWSLLHHLDHRVVYVIGVLVVVSFLVILLTNRLKIPSVVGYIFVGILFSVDMVEQVPFLSIGQKEWYAYLINSFNYVTILAVSVISFTIGTELSIKELKHLEREFTLIVVLESLGTFLLVTGSMLALGQSLCLALVLGAIASATAPAATVLVLREYKAHGELAATLLVVLALDEALALIIFGFAESIALISVSTMSVSFYNAFIIPLAKLLGATVIGLNIGYFSQKLMHMYYDQKTKQILLLLATVFGVSALTIALGVSPLIANLAVGFAYRNFTKKHLGIAKHLDTLTVPLYAIFFILAGTNLRFSTLTSLNFLVIAVVYLLARMMGKIGGSSLGAWLSGAPAKVRKYIGLGLLPQAGVAIDLAYTVQRDFVHAQGLEIKIGQLVFNILLFTTAITEIAGPLLTEYALIKTKEGKNI